MPSRSDHLRQAAANNELLHWLSTNNRTYPDWLVTIGFYTALHYIDAFLATQMAPDGIHPHDHASRTGAVSMFKDLKVIFQDYQYLYDFCNDCRYKCKFKGQNDASATQAIARTERIEKFIMSLK